MLRRLGPAAVLALLALASCGGDDDGGRRESRSPDLLFVHHRASITGVDPLTGRRAATTLAAVPAGDWSALYRASASPGGTALLRVEPETGVSTVVAEAGGELGVHAVSHDGGVVVMLPGPLTGAASPYVPRPRARTRVVVVRTRDGEVRDLDVPANVAPEAVSLDGDDLFVVEYLPPLAPERYRVRRLGLRTGRLEPVHSPDGHLQEAMQGDARTQVASPDGRRLYTFYTLATEDRTRAFVHVLDLDEEWAHCVELAPAFASPSASLALALTPDGDELHVVDRGAGAVSVVDTGRLTVSGTVPIGRRPGPVAAAADGRGTLYLASGDEVEALRPATGEVRRSWALDEPVTTLLASAGRLYAGQGTSIEVLDVVTGRELPAIAEDEVVALSRPGSAPSATVALGGFGKCGNC